MAFNREQIIKTLTEINRRVSDRLGTPVVEKEAYGAIKQVVTGVIEDNSTKKDKRDELETVMKSGMLDKLVQETDKERAEIFEQEIKAEIHRAMKLGKLPHPSRDPFIKSIKSKWRKAKRK